MHTIGRRMECLLVANVDCVAHRSVCVRTFAVRHQFIAVGVAIACAECRWCKCQRDERGVVDTVVITDGIVESRRKCECNTVAFAVVECRGECPCGRQPKQCKKWRCGSHCQQSDDRAFHIGDLYGSVACVWRVSIGARSRDKIRV